MSTEYNINNYFNNRTFISEDEKHRLFSAIRENNNGKNPDEFPSFMGIRDDPTNPFKFINFAFFYECDYTTEESNLLRKLENHLPEDEKTGFLPAEYLYGICFLKNNIRITLTKQSSEYPFIIGFYDDIKPEEFFYEFNDLKSAMTKFFNLSEKYN